MAKKDVRIIDGVTKIVEIENGKIIKVVRDYKNKHEDADKTFVDIANRFYNNIKNFVSIYGVEYYNYKYDIYEKLDKDYPENGNLSYNENRKLFDNYKNAKLEKLPSKNLRKIICNYIIERFNLICKIYKIRIPYLENEEGMVQWFKKNCGYFFDLGIISRHIDGIDYLCEYGFDPLIISFILKDEKVLDFFYAFIDPKNTHKECGTKHLQIELEYLSGNFISHKHSVESTDMIICFKKNKHIDIPILELNQWSEKPVKRKIDEYLEDLDHHLGISWNLLGKRLGFVRFEDYDFMEELICETYDLLKYIESYRYEDNEKHEIKNFLVSDHRLRMILESLSIVNIIKKNYIDDIINNGTVNIEFFVEKDILSRLINENKVIFH